MPSGEPVRRDDLGGLSTRCTQEDGGMGSVGEAFAMRGGLHRRTLTTTQK